VRLRYPDAQAPGGTVDVSGFSLPGLPAIVVGSNGHVAWGFTNSYIDNADFVHVPAHAPGTLDGITTHTERIRVAGQPDTVLRVRETAWGPILHERPDGSGEALRWTAQLPGAVRLDFADMARAGNLDDALRIADAAGRTERACVIGGGFIGLEVASALRARGAEVTVVEAQPHLLARAFPPLMSSYVENAHRRRGVALLTGRGVRALHGAQGRVAAVELDDGTRIDCDLVVLGIGVLPNAELAQQAGIAVDNGIVVDMLGRTSAPRVLAAGDVASMALPPAPGVPARMRLESIQSANDGARALASLVVGREAPCTAVPWFWSDQFDLKLQMTGLAAPGDEVVLRGDMASDRFSVFYLRQGTLVAAHSVNKPAEHMQSRKLIGARARLGADQLADPSFDLKTVA